MQIILVSRTKKVPKTLDLACRRMRWRIATLGVVAVAGCMALGAAVALTVASPRDRALSQISELQHKIDAQDAKLGAVKQDAQRNLDALAVKLGQLQAQSTRLNALGERLAQMGKLDDGEFNFDQAPPVGGVEDTSGAAYTLPQNLESSISQLATQFDGQQAQLTALQSLLMDARIESNLKPTGMPVQGYISSYFGGVPTRSAATPRGIPASISPPRWARRCMRWPKAWSPLPASAAAMATSSRSTTATVT